MKKKIFVRSLLIFTAVAGLAIFSGCNGGGGGNGGSSASSDNTDTTYDPCAVDPSSCTNTVVVVEPSDPTDNGGGSSDSGDYGDPSGCDASGCNSFAGVGGTKDVDLQKAQRAQASLNLRAQAVANKFQMGFQSAYQLTELADKVKKLTVAGQMTADDRAAVTKSAFDIAGVTPDQVNDAAQRSMQGDNSATDALIDKAAQNLGMSSPSSLRDTLLPALGVHVD